MIEALLWTLSGPLLATQTGAPAEPMGNRSDCFAPHGAWRCAGEDAWLSLAVRNDNDWRALCRLVPALAPLSGHDFSKRVVNETEIAAILTAWLHDQEASAVARSLGVFSTSSVTPRGLAKARRCSTELKRYCILCHGTWRRLWSGHKAR